MSAKIARRAGIMAAALCVLIIAALPSLVLANQGDRNGDGLPDRWERKHGLSLKKNQAKHDQDRDGLRNKSEFRAKIDPRDADTDGDGVEDGDEDRDGDKVDNFNEQDEGTNPSDKDSDDDGRADGREDADHDGLNNMNEDDSANDPDDRDTDDDGTRDGNEVIGEIVSFDGSILTISLSNGGSISAPVTGDTEIGCETEDEYEHGNESDEGGDSNDLNDNENGDGDEHGDEDNVCGVDDLVAGTMVHEAEFENGDFEEIELIK